MFRTISLAALAALASAAAVPAQAAQYFDFSFTAPLSNGDVASGAGQLVTEDPDVDGHYAFSSATGTFTVYAGEPTLRPISMAMGFEDIFDFGDGFLYENAPGLFVTDAVAFIDWPTFNIIGFRYDGNGQYSGFSGEVSISGATLTFTPTAGAVPEPASWAMMIGGFGVIGAALRRRVTLVRLA